jgi:transposase InsO family protein
LADTTAHPAQPGRQELGARVQLPCERSDLGRQVSVGGLTEGRHGVRAAQDRAVDAAAGSQNSLPMLDLTFEALAPNRKWIADFTYAWTAGGLPTCPPSSIFSPGRISLTTSHPNGAQARLPAEN